MTAWTVGRLLTSAAEFLAKRGVDEPRLSAEILLGHALDCTRIQLYTRYEQIPDDGRRARYRELIQNAANHAPIAYLVGFKEFFSLTFEVTPDVLIPRPETETLVERAVAWCRARRPVGGNGDADPVQLLDLGCGSGCIIIAAMKQLPHARGLATDVSPGALNVARRNAERHALGDRLRFAAADRFDLPAGGDGVG
ncbi:MAG: peptide chain release factor N(5)-glutamine methyltransferase, partial [Phycisphaerales bacterium]|nr:peptide chain release factor N(5)-glutamine methyltransferase [Phycisphaerales bacterium]